MQKSFGAWGPNSECGEYSSPCPYTGEEPYVWCDRDIDWGVQAVIAPSLYCSGYDYLTYYEWTCSQYALVCVPYPTCDGTIVGNSVYCGTSPCLGTKTCEKATDGSLNSYWTACDYSETNNDPCGSPGACTYSNVCSNTGSQTMPICSNGTCNNSNTQPCTRNTNGTACNDSNACTNPDTCSSGTCSGTTITCNDNNSCTTDTCNTSSGCVYTTISGSHNACTAPFVCSSVANTPAACTNSCSINSDCGCVANVGQSCNDGNACTTGETIQCNGSCGNGSAVTCNDSNSCTTDTCNTSSGCVYTTISGSHNACSGSSCVFSVANTSSACSNTCSSNADCGGTIICSSNGNCNDYNSCTNDVCVNPGTTSSYCTNNTVGGNHNACSGSSCISVANTSSACSDTCSSNADCSSGQPDLTVYPLNVSPTSATVGTGQTFTATISNIGSASTVNSFNNFFQVATAANGGGTISALSVNSRAALGAGANGPVTSSAYTFPSAQIYSVRVCADNNSSWVGTIAESNEGNNCGAWTSVAANSASCTVPPALRTSTSGFSPTTVNINTGVNIWCDWGSNTYDFGKPYIGGISDCTWDDWTGTVANYTCQATQAGSLSVYCNTIYYPPPGSNYCASTNNIGTLTVNAPASCGGSGSIKRDYWTGIAGNLVTDLTGLAAFPNSPSGTNQPTSFEAPTDWADSYGTRMYGYVHAAETGNYTFYIASDDYSELWLSTNDNPANKVKIAYVNGWTNSRIWNKYPATQTSSAKTLTAGQKYYIEALQKEGSGGDNLAVGYTTPLNATITVIPGVCLSPYYISDPDGAGGNNTPCERINMWWFRNSASNYNVYRNTVNNSATAAKIQNNIAYTDPTYGGFTDSPSTGLVPATTYYYWIENVGGANRVPVIFGGVYNVQTAVCPTATANITATPPGPLPFSNTGTQIDWWSTNATPGSCVVSHNNPFVANWATGESGGQSTGPIPFPGRTYNLTCQPTGLNSSVNVGVNVQAQPTNGLNLIKTGQGTVTGTPSSPTTPGQTVINCGAGCPGVLATYTSDTTVTLTAAAIPGRIFTGWSINGNTSTCPRGSGPTFICAVDMGSPKTVIANFAVDPNYREF